MVIALSSCASLENRPYIKFEEAKLAPSKPAIKHLAIIGMGISPTRFFLDKMTNELIDDLKKKGIQTTYYYLGNDVQKAKQQFEALLLANSCDAVMSIFQTDFAEIKYIKDNFFLFSQTSYAHVTITHLRFNQGFNIKLYGSKDLTQPFWASALNINYDFHNPVLYRTISNKMIASLKKNEVCQ